MVDKEKVSRAISFYGTTTESIVAMEELSELIQCISKGLRGAGSPDHLAEEIADTMIMLESVQQMYDIPQDRVQAWIDTKQNRTAIQIARGAYERLL